MDAQEEIRDVMTRYCWHVDHAEWDAWLGLFAEDSVWGAKGARPFEGREAMTKLVRGLAKNFDPAVPSRHFPVNLLIAVDGERATLKTYLMTVRALTKEIARIGEYDMTLIRQEGRWLIRTMEFLQLSEA